jgi:hypothetical protein
MVRAWGWFALAAMGSGVMACSLLKKPAAVDGGEDAGAVGSASVPEASASGEAVNASEMTRYPDEKPVDHAPLTVESVANLRTQAGSGGDLVVVLKKGTEVEKLAEHEGYYLVLADDPKDPTRKLMGWVSESAFGAAAPHGRGEPEPPPPPHVAVVDAGTKPPSPPPGPVKPLDVHKTNGACPPGYASCAAVCRLTCKAESECGIATAKCTGGFCVGPGAVPCK